ncbi:WD40-repeat-containing domain protein [Pilobolus umbonatus]|nr:WD40-repeat-containing domain protein [Pilobolus umbonatus]
MENSEEKAERVGGTMKGGHQETVNEVSTETVREVSTEMVTEMQERTGNEVQEELVTGVQEGTINEVHQEVVNGVQLETAYEGQSEIDNEEQPVTEVQAEVVNEVQEETTGYSVFIPDFQQGPCSLVSSTLDRYTTSMKECLEQDMSLLHQPIDLAIQSDSYNYFRNAKWSPDGSCLLTNSADNIIRLFQLPSDIYEDSHELSHPWTPTFAIREGEAINDFAWFPFMSSQDPSTCCFLTSVRDHPVRLWDLNTGTVRASYSVVDHCEKFIGPNVITFNLDGSKLYCGYENMIEIFDTNSGGSSSVKVPTIPKRRSKKGQKGIISCIDFSPDHSGLYAAGSYSQSIGLYDESVNELCYKLTGFQGGTTQVKFSKDGTLLFSASRHSNSILCWDIRDSANILYELPRKGRTNQRIHFDIDATGRYLMTGDEEGKLLIYDITTGEEEDVETKQRLIQSFNAHRDLISSASFNPVYPIISTCSGQRIFEIEDDTDDEMSVDRVIDCSLKGWKMNGQYEWFSYTNELQSTDMVL